MSELETIVVVGRKMSAKEAKRAKKQRARKEKRAKLAEIRTEADIDRLEKRLRKKLQKADDARQGYSSGGIAKAN